MADIDVELTQDDIDRINGLAKSTPRGLPLPPLDPAQMPGLLGRQVQRGLRSLDEIFAQARAGTTRGMLPSFVPPESAVAKTAELINPVPGSLPQAAGLGAAMAIPGGGLLGALGRAGGAGVAAGGTEALMGGQSPWETGAGQAVSQLAGEAPFLVGRGILGQLRGRQAFQAEQAQIKQAEAARAQYPGQLATFQQSEQARKAQVTQAERDRANLYAQQKAQFKAQEAQRVSGAEAAQQASALAQGERQAAQIASVVKSQVPAWGSKGDTPRDLWHMAFGTDWKLVQDRFDQSLKGIIQAGRGQMIQIRRDAAEALGVPLTALGPKEAAAVGTIDYAMVDAGDLAKSMTGKWTNRQTRGAYRQAARALDEANIGDPAARAEYRNASSFRAFADKSQMLQNQQFHPERVQKALGQLRANVEVLGPRQNVELFQALEAAKPSVQPPIQPPQAYPPYQRGPAFTPGTPPLAPPAPPEPTVRYGPLGTRSLPATMTGVGGGILGYELGKMAGHPWPGYFAGHAVGQTLGGRIPAYQGGPRVPAPGPLGRGAREIVGQDVQRVWDYIMSSSE